MKTCKYSHCQKPLTEDQIKATLGENICQKCLKERIEFQKKVNNYYDPIKHKTTN